MNKNHEMIYQFLVQSGIEHPAISQIDILERIMISYVDQQKKGLEKYKTPVNPSDDYDWLEMKLEERIDGTVYSICELLQLQEKKRKTLMMDEITRKVADKLRSGELNEDQLRMLLR